MRTFIKVFLALLFVVLLAFGVVQLLEVEGGNWGSFEGRPVSTWDDDGRNMTLERQFTYVDPRGKHWTAPKGAVVNGASIPRAFWPLIGGPFEGKYRNASIVHDVYCENMREPSHAVHLMFFEACRCGGVSERDAKILYFAVANFGPKWERLMQSTGNGQEPAVRVIHATRSPSDDDVKKIVAYFDDNNPEIELIPSLKIPL